MTTENPNQPTNEESTNVITSPEDHSPIPKERRKRPRIDSNEKDQSNPVRFDYAKENLSIRTKLILLNELGILKYLRDNFPALGPGEALSKLLAEVITGDIDPTKFKIAYNSLRSDLSCLIDPNESTQKEGGPYTTTAIKKANSALTKHGLPLCKVS